MRVLPLVIILAILGAVGYVYWFHWDDVSRLARGYRAAQTPDEAMAFFEKAVKSRDYKTAALYCTEPYAEYMRKAHTAARAIGLHMDRFKYYMDEKALGRDGTLTAIYFFDPFPKYFSQKGAPKVNDKDASTATGVIELDTFGAFKLNPPFLIEHQNIDHQMFRAALLPWAFTQQATGPLLVAVPLKEIDDNGTKSWKLDLPLTRAEDINYFLSRWKTYDTGLNQSSTFLTMERMASPQEMETLLMKVFQDAKK